MRRLVRVSTTLSEDVEGQIGAEQAASFWSQDLTSAIELLATGDLWESLPIHGGGRRLTVEGISVGAFHLFIAKDELDGRENALVIYAVDIWPDGFPD